MVIQTANLPNPTWLADSALIWLEMRAFERVFGY